MRDNSRHLVVAKYKEDVSWLSKVNIPYTVYDKSDDPMLYSFRLPNVGREAHTYLYYIVENYHRLPDVVIFSQGDPISHTRNFIEKIHRLQGDKVLGLTEKYLEGVAPDPTINFYRFTEQGFYFAYGIVDHQPGWIPTYPNPMHMSATEMVWDSLFSSPLPQGKSLLFSFGALLYVPKAAILARSLEFYKKCLELCGEKAVTNSYNPGKEMLEPWVFELLWFYIFDRQVKFVGKW